MTDDILDPHVTFSMSRRDVLVMTHVCHLAAALIDAQEPLRQRILDVADILNAVLGHDIDSAVPHRHAAPNGRLSKALEA